ELAESIGASGIVLHINKHPPNVIAHVMDLLRPHAKKHGVQILLEMVASKADPGLTYETAAKLNRLGDMISGNKRDPDGTGWWAYCVDTAHLWGAGIDVAESKNMSNMFRDLKYEIGLFHLNGAGVSRGSGRDKH